MRHVTVEDVARTRQVLAELATQADALTAELAATGLTDAADQLEWLFAHRTPDQVLAWERHWSHLFDGMPRAPRTVKLKPKRRLKADEVFEEAEWLLSNGVAPWEVGVALGRSQSALSRLAYRYGRTDLGTRLLPDNNERKAA